MTIRESIRSQWATMKDRPFKEKLKYFWHYYGVWTIVGIFAIICAVSLITTVATKKDPAFNGALFGVSAGQNAHQYLADFIVASQIDPEQYDYSIQLYPAIDLKQPATEETYHAVQHFNALVTAKDIEVIGADTALFIHFAYQGYMTDLRTVLTSQQLEAISEHLYYIDKEVLKAIENAKFGEDVTGGKYPDPKDPKSMADPVPVGIDLNAADPVFLETYRFLSENPVIGICGSTLRENHAKQFLYYIFGALTEG